MRTRLIWIFYIRQWPQGDHNTDKKNLSSAIRLCNFAKGKMELRYRGRQIGVSVSSAIADKPSTLTPIKYIFSEGF